VVANLPDTVPAMGERLVEANGVDLCVDSFGSPDDPAVLLIQGVGASMDWWEDGFCEQLAAAGRFVIRYDNRDTGRSVTYPVGAPGYGLTDLAADAVGVLDAVGVERAHVVGVSMGGIVGQLLALDHADRVASLTLLSTTPKTPMSEDADLPGVTDELMAFFEVPVPDWSDRDAAATYIVGFGRALAGTAAPFDEAGMRALVERVIDRTTNLESSMTNHDFVINGPERWRERLGKIAVPTLVLHGTEDPLFPLEHGEALAREIPGARLVPLERVGHAELPRVVWDDVVATIAAHTAVPTVS
jgi:pimeloyl-ACP methyl ester carboxylesterase